MLKIEKVPYKLSKLLLALRNILLTNASGRVEFYTPGLTGMEHGKRTGGIWEPAGCSSSLNFFMAVFTQVVTTSSQLTAAESISPREQKGDTSFSLSGPTWTSLQVWCQWGSQLLCTGGAYWPSVCVFNHCSRSCCCLRLCDRQCKWTHLNSAGGSGQYSKSRPLSFMIYSQPPFHGFFPYREPPDTFL